MLLENRIPGNKFDCHFQIENCHISVNTGIFFVKTIIYDILATNSDYFMQKREMEHEFNLPLSGLTKWSTQETSWEEK